MIETNILGAFGISSAICCHLLSKTHHEEIEPWYYNKWFWAGLFGSIPVLIALIAHIHFTKIKK